MRGVNTDTKANVDTNVALNAADQSGKAETDLKNQNSIEEKIQTTLENDE
ncbi:MAG: hypothetical protein ACXACO_14230 [Promethearchaeota archaeon]|jgi:hypothetical protein